MSLTKTEKNYIEVSPVGQCRLDKKEELEYALVYLLKEYIVNNKSVRASDEALGAIKSAEETILNEYCIPVAIGISKGDSNVIYL